MLDNKKIRSDAVPRIAMVSTHGYVAANPPLGATDTGGQVVFVLELSKKLATLGYAVDIWTRRFEDQEEIEQVDDHVRIIRMPCGGADFIPKEYLYRYLPEWGRNALRFVREHDLEYVFLNSHYWDAGIAAEHLSAALDVPHVHTPHSLGLWKLREMERDFPHERASFEAKYNFEERIRHEKAIYASAQIVAATTPIQLDMLVEDYGVEPGKLRLIPPGYDDTRFFPVGDATREAVAHRLGLSGKVVLALGRLARNKGYDLLIEAFALIAAREPEANLHLAVGGEELGEEEQRLLEELKERVAVLGLNDRVHFDGYVADEQLADFYRAADVFVLCSRYEPFGMTAIEAMACGAPVVVTTHGGLWRAVTYGEHALYADPFDREELAMAILAPLKYCRLRERLSTLGAQRARALFTWTGIAQQLLAALDGDRSGAESFLPSESTHRWMEAN